MALPRTLDAAEIRVLGSLLEKERTTPDAYPLTVNSLTSACNQKSNRDPVMSLSQADVLATLDRLHGDVLVWPVEGARVQRWRHSLERRMALDPPEMAIITLLFLRGPQTAGELRTRAERLHPFHNPSEVEQCLLTLTEGENPHVTQVKRQAGQKERRWMHLVGGPIDDQADEVRLEPPQRSAGPSLAERVAQLEERVTHLETLLSNNTANSGGANG
jgi:uncharacterized protein YceH (UPF0502 family)